MSQTDTDPKKWISKPTKTFDGLRLVDHDGTVFIEQIRSDGQEHQSIMIREDEVGGFVKAVKWLAHRRSRKEDLDDG